MAKNLITLLQELPHAVAPAGFDTAIFNRLLTAQNRRRAWYLALSFTGASALLVGALVPLVVRCVTLFYSSGAGEFIAMMFTDTSTFLLYWKEILNSVFESLPIIQMTGVLALVLVLFVSLGFAIKHIINLTKTRYSVA